MKRQAFTREEIAALEHEDLLKYFSDDEVKAQSAITSMGFTKPAKRADESVGQYRQRCRESAEVDKAEKGRALRTALESALWQKQAGHRMVDMMNSSFSPEEKERLHKNEEARNRRDALVDREHGGEGPRPKGYPSGLTRE